MNFFNDRALNENQDAKFDASYGTSQYSIVLAAPMKNNFYLRSELGIIKTNSFVDIDYETLAFPGTTTQSITSVFLNQKLFISISPEYRINRNRYTLKFHLGPIISTDISKILSASDDILRNDTSQLGFDLGSGIAYRKNAIGGEFNISYKRIGQSNFFVQPEPRFGYDQIHFNLGIIYFL